MKTDLLCLLDRFSVIAMTISRSVLLLPSALCSVKAHGEKDNEEYKEDDGRAIGGWEVEGIVSQSMSPRGYCAVGLRWIQAVLDA